MSIGAIISGKFLWLLTAACPFMDAQAGDLGTSEVAPLPAAQAMALNAEGKAEYRREHFESATQLYRKAFEADPSMVAAEFNLSCGLSRLQRYEEAANRAADAIKRACVPWVREVFESADLAILASTPHWGAIRENASTACLKWGSLAKEGVLFVARQHPPVRLSGEGLLVLKLHQEVYSYIPSSGRYFQLTSEDGRVLAMAKTPDNRMTVYVTGTKLVRSKSSPALLRGLAIRTLSLPAMKLSRSVEIGADVQKIALAISPASVVELEYIDASSAKKLFRFDGERLDPIAKSTAPNKVHRTMLSGEGVSSGDFLSLDRPCSFSLQDVPDPFVPKIAVSAGKRIRFQIKSRYGAGLNGMPFPIIKEASSSAPSSSSNTKK